MRRVYRVEPITASRNSKPASRTGFRIQANLGDVSEKALAERVGFEPTITITIGLPL